MEDQDETTQSDDADKTEGDQALHMVVSQPCAFNVGLL